MVPSNWKGEVAGGRVAGLSKKRFCTSASPPTSISPPSAPLGSSHAHPQLHRAFPESSPDSHEIRSAEKVIHKVSICSTFEGFHPYLCLGCTSAGDALVPLLPPPSSPWWLASGRAGPGAWRQGHSHQGSSPAESQRGASTPCSFSATPGGHELPTGRSVTKPFAGTPWAACCVALSSRKCLQVASPGSHVLDPQDLGQVVRVTGEGHRSEAGNLKALPRLETAELATYTAFSSSKPQNLN